MQLQPARYAALQQPRQRQQRPRPRVRLRLRRQRRVRVAPQRLAHDERILGRIVELAAFGLSALLPRERLKALEKTRTP